MINENDPNARRLPNPNPNVNREMLEAFDENFFNPLKEHMDDFFKGVVKGIERRSEEVTIKEDNKEEKKGKSVVLITFLGTLKRIKGSLSTIREGFANISESFRAFGSMAKDIGVGLILSAVGLSAFAGALMLFRFVQWDDLIKGSAAILALGVTLSLFVLGVTKAGGTDALKTIGKSLIALAGSLVIFVAALYAMKGLSPQEILIGISVIAVSMLSLALAARKGVFSASVAMFVLGGALLFFAKIVLPAMETVSWSNLLMAGVMIAASMTMLGVIGNFYTQILLGALALATAAGALALFAFSLRVFDQPIKWKDAWISLGFIAALSTVLGVVGTFAPVIALGVGILALMGPAIALFAGGAAVGMMALGKGLEKFSEGLQGFTRIDRNTILTAMLAIGLLVPLGGFVGVLGVFALGAGAGMIALGQGLISLGYGLRAMSGVSIFTIGATLVLLGGLAVISRIAGGLFGMGANSLTGFAQGIMELSSALPPLAFGLKSFEDVKWSTLGKAGLVMFFVSFMDMQQKFSDALLFWSDGGIGKFAQGLKSFATSLPSLAAGLKAFEDVGIGAITKSGVVIFLLSLLDMQQKFSDAILFWSEGGLDSFANGLLKFANVLQPLATGFKAMESVSTEAIGKIGLIVAALFGLDVAEAVKGVFTMPKKLFDKFVGDEGSSVLKSLQSVADFMTEMAQVEIRAVADDLAYFFDTISEPMKKFGEILEDFPADKMKSFNIVINRNVGEQASFERPSQKIKNETVEMGERSMERNVASGGGTTVIAPSSATNAPQINNSTHDTNLTYSPDPANRDGTPADIQQEAYSW